MQVEIIKKEKQKQSVWDGGTTAELFIYPPESEYRKRNFFFRVSSARCEKDRSSFTYLPDTERILLVLDGQISLVFKGKPALMLKQGTQVSFSGKEEAESSGRCTDFNLMLRKGYGGTVLYRELKEHEACEVKPETDYTCLYLVSGKCILANDSTVYELSAGDAVYLRRQKENESMTVNAEESSRIALACAGMPEKRTDR